MIVPHPQDPALTADELAQAAKLLVWVIWYEDQFHWGDERDSFPLAICLSQEESEREYRRRIESGTNKPLTPGWDGITIEGPWTLMHEGQEHPWEYGVDVVREVLKRAKDGKPGPVFVPIR
ncbi:MAG TPA: hypothetical protein VGK88_10625 [bacterium]|jgi:hypothetical protein